MDWWTLAHSAFTLLVIWQMFRYVKKYRISNRRETDLNFRQQRLFKEIQTLKDEKANFKEQLEKAQEQIRYANRGERNKRRIQV